MALGLIAEQVAASRNDTPAMLAARIFFWLGALGLVMAGIGFFATRTLQADEAIYAREGVRTAAIVLNPDTGNSANSTSTGVLLEFTTTSGARTQRDYSVPQSAYMDLRRGQSVDIVYARSNPAKMRLAKEDRREDIVAFGWFLKIGAALVGFCVVVLTGIQIGRIHAASRVVEIAPPLRTPRTPRAPGDARPSFGRR